jgi:hypothetical protein
MKGKGIALLVIAVVAIGIFALPCSVSLFSGQHTWYDIGASVGSTPGANNVPCEKCHAEIEEEMLSGNNGAHENLTCSMCHRAPFTGYGYARGGYNVGETGVDPAPGEEAHAASTVECMDCHGIWKDANRWKHWSDPEYAGNCKKCHGGYGDFISAGGFGIEDPGNPGHNSTDTDTGEKAAHKKFVLDAIDEPLMEGANEACISCHTRIGVDIEWTKRENLNFNASENQTGRWTIINVGASGDNVTQVSTPNAWTDPL